MAWVKKQTRSLPCLWAFEPHLKKSSGTSFMKAHLNNKTPHCFPAAHLHYIEPRPRLPTREHCEPSALRKKGSDSSAKRDGEEEEAAKNYCTAPSFYVHTAKSTAAFYFGCFYHFGSLTWAPREAINFKPRSLLPVEHLTFPPPLKERRVEKEEKKQAKSNLLFLYEIYSPGVLVNNDLIYQWLSCYLHCFRRVFSACDWAELFSRMERGGGRPGRLTSVWSKFMWNFPGPPGESLFMNCNKKSHFDGVTSVHGQEGGGKRDLVMSLFARRRCSHRPYRKWTEKKKKKRGRDSFCSGEGL